MQFIVDTTGHVEAAVVQAAEDLASGVRRAGAGSDPQERVQAGQVQGQAGPAAGAAGRRVQAAIASFPQETSQHERRSSSPVGVRWDYFAKGIVAHSGDHVHLVADHHDPEVHSVPARPGRDPEVRAPVLPRHPGREPGSGDRPGREEQEEPCGPRGGRGAGRGEAAAARPRDDHRGRHQLGRARRRAPDADHPGRLQARHRHPGHGRFHRRRSSVCSAPPWVS